MLPHGGVRLDIQWGAPYGGHGYDEFHVISADEMQVVSHLDVHKHGQHTYTFVYRRKQ